MATLCADGAPFVGVPQSSQGSCDGSPSDRQTSHGHPDSSCACPHGGRPPDADALDQEDHCGGGAHGPAAGAHLASDSAAFQGMWHVIRPLL
jgi:hypothetical protein